MLGFVIFVGVWNAVAVAIGIVGLFKPEARPGLARFVNRQASAALAISLVCAVLGILGNTFGPLAGAGQLLGWFFWAAGGLLPLTITMLLRAGPRKHGES